MVRKIDELGRITLPIEARQELGLYENIPVEVISENGQITLKKHVDCCISCGAEADLLKLTKVIDVCRGCIGKLTSHN